MEKEGRWRMGGTGERKALEEKVKVIAEDWEALETGMRWRLGGAGEW